MARTEQRKRRAHHDPDQQSHAAVYQVLPLGELPTDFAGQPIDGLEYLAWAKKGDSELPFFVSAPNPYAQPEASTSTSEHQALEPVASSSNGRMISSNGIYFGVDTTAADATVSSSTSLRHPDLWKESWAAAFDVHWRNYRHCVQTIPSATTSSYPVPLPSKRPAWEQFIHGAPRRLRSELAAKAARRAGSCSLSEFGIDEDDEREKKKIRVEIMVDEEEEMRALNEGGGEMAVDEIIHEEEEEDDELYEPEELRHRSKEPTMEIVRHMNQQHHLLCISYLTQYMTDRLSRLPLPSDSHLLSTQPGSMQQAQPSTCSFPSTHPFPPLHARWGFSALANLSPHLTSDSISTIRSFARAATEFAEWLSISLKNKDDDRQDALANCWMVVRGVGVEWGQSDLIDDAERTFKKLL